MAYDFMWRRFRTSRLLCSLLVIALIGCGGDEMTTPPPPPPPPAGPVLASAFSPFPTGCEQSFQGKSVNYQNSDVEPWLVIDPTDPTHLIGIWQQDRWSNGGAHGLMTGVSRDGGKTWTHSFAHFSRCAGGNSGNGGDYERASDPWVTISPDGTLYESALSFNFSNANQAVEVSRSTDGGDTWSDPTTLMFDNDPTVSQDKDSSTADPQQVGFVYAIWSRYVFTDAAQNVLLKSPAWFSRTTDGGATWEPARVIYDPPAGFYALGHEIVVLPNGSLVDMFLQYDDTSANYFTITSSDRGLTWSPPTLIDVSNDIGITDVETGELVRGGVANIVVDPNTGALYFVWQDARFSSGARDGIAFSTSTDSGMTWSPAMQVNQAPNVQAFAPSIAVAQDGTIAIDYYDFRKDTSDPNTLLTNYWQITSDDGGSTWREVSLSPSFDIRTAPVTGLGFMVTDYEGLVAMGNSFVSLFVSANSSDTSNRTDVFAISSGAAASMDLVNGGRIEVNRRPLTVKEQMRLRRERPLSVRPH